jgi:hypothetical protein
MLTYSPDMPKRGPMLPLMSKRISKSIGSLSGAIFDDRSGNAVLASDEIVLAEPWNSPSVSEHASRDRTHAASERNAIVHQTGQRGGAVPHA